jgi:mannose-6-phosphate isomerase
MQDWRYPYLFERRLLEKVWGARRLERIFGFELPPAKAIGESWELSDHPSGESAIRSGPLRGRSLRSLMSEHGPGIVGNAPLARGGRFPLLVKFVDADDRLSVQVHPDDAAAARLGESDGGKNEAWYVLHSEPGAVLWVGLADGKNKKDVEHAKTKIEFERCMRALEPRAGDCVALPAGTIHAIGPGFTLCEVQQTSDVTYRLYDWDRPASAGRKLHREESFAVARFDARGEAVTAKPSSRNAQFAEAELPSPGTFRWSRCEASADFARPESNNFRILIFLSGSARLACGRNPQLQTEARAGDAVLVPADSGDLRAALPGRAEFLFVEPK